MRYLHSLDDTLFRARDENNDTALTLAGYYGSEEAVNYLITELKVDVRETGENGRNCFLSATEGGKIDMMRYLHSLDDTLCRARDENNDTALTLAGYYGSKESVEYLVTEPGWGIVPLLAKNCTGTGTALGGTGTALTRIGMHWVLIKMHVLPKILCLSTKNFEIRFRKHILNVLSALSGRQ